MDADARHILEAELAKRERRLEDGLNELRWARGNRNAASAQQYDGTDARPELEMWAAGLLNLCEFALGAAQITALGATGLAIVIPRIKAATERYDTFTHPLARTLQRDWPDSTSSAQNRLAFASAARKRREVADLIEGAELRLREIAGSPQKPSDAEIVSWIRTCGTGNSKEGWQIIHANPAFVKVKKKDFDHCWKIVWPNRQRGRPNKIPG